MSNNNKRAGNVLVFILIAIFLMGALTMLFVRSDGQSEDTGDTEQASLYASKILTYTANVENTVSRLLMQGCSQNEISFWRDTNHDGLETIADSNYNANAPTDKSCHVFSPNGGGMQPAGTDDMFATAAFYHIGTSGHEIYYVTQYDHATAPRGLSNAVCAAINRRLENGITMDALPAADITANSFTGTYTGYTLGDNGAEVGMYQIKAACIEDIACGTGRCNSFYRILLVR